MTSGRVRIVGSGALTGSGSGVDALWRAVSYVRPGIDAHDFGDPRLQPRYVRIADDHRPNETDLASSWLRRVSDDALGEAADVLADISKDAPRVALIAGSSLGGVAIYEHERRRGYDAGPGVLHLTEAPSHFAGRYDGPTSSVGDGLGINAGAWSINTACSSATNAIGLARTWLLRRRIDAAVVAGYDVISPFVYAGFLCLSALDSEATTPFSENRAGLNLGEAALALVLVRQTDAAGVERPVDVIGYGSSCDAHHLTRPDLSGAGLRRAIEAALSNAGKTPSDIDAISAHGTGTPFNDRMEAAAFESLFCGDCPPIHCAKPIAGHTLGAAGLIDAVITAEALRHEIWPPTFQRGPRDPELPVHPSTEWGTLTASAVVLSTSSGFGGSNAALLMQRGDPP